jgi:class I lanthipeptide synthase
MTNQVDPQKAVRHSVQWHGARQRIFRALDFYMVRAAALPLHLCDAPLRDPRFLEAIALASPSLLARLDSVEGGARSSLGNVKTDLAVGRYARRMATRPTPFGLFAGVGTGRFGSASALSLGALAEWRRHTRPDMEWLLALVRSLETDEGLCPSVRVQPNPLVVTEGERLVLTNPSRWDPSPAKDGKQNRFNVSIRATRPVVLALELAGKELTIGALVSEVAAALEEGVAARVESLVRGLLAREFLISELRPSAAAGDPLRHVSSVVARLSGHQDLAHALRELELLIAHYAGAPPEEGKARMQKVRAAMQPLTGSTRHLHVDLAIPSPDIMLPAAVGDEFARAADVMWRLSNDKPRLQHLRDYHADFLVRFGLDREIPLAELLHEEIGLGPPRTYLEPAPTRAGGRSAPSASGMARLAELSYAAAARGEREIVLTEALIDTLVAPHEATAPPSFELYAEVLAASPDDLDRGDFQLVLSPIVGADDAGKTFGRFLYFLPQSIVDGLRAIRSAESATEPEVIFAELSHLPATAKVSNMALTPCLRDYEISVATSASRPGSWSIPLGDLMVGATPERLFLRSRSSGREIVISTTHMLNYELLPNVVRLGLEISLARSRPFSLLDMGALQGAAFYPRLCYRRTILSPATWNFRRSDIEALGSPWRSGFRAWRKRWWVPRYVFIGFADQRLLLDLDDESHVDELDARSRKQDSIAMIEMIGTFQDRIFASDGGRHFTECVVPLARITPAKPSTLPRTRFGSCGSTDLRTRFPGSEWLYLKLYCNPDRLDRLLVEQVSPFADACVSSGLAERWFHIFYKDPESHLRLRLYTANVAARSPLLEQAGLWTGALLRNGQLRDMAVVPYERETERYGGIDLIGDAEAFFCKDSQLCAGLVAGELSGDCSLDRVQLMAIAAADIVMRTGDTAPKDLLRAGKLDDPARFGKSFRAICAAIWPLDRGETNPEGAWIKQQLDGRADALAGYLAAIRSTIPEDPREAELRAIIQSLIHMQCNRMNGDERAALALAKRIVNWIAAVTAAAPAGS